MEITMQPSGIGKLYTDGINQGFKEQNNKEIAQNIHDSIAKTLREPYEFVAFVNGPSKTRLRNNRQSL